MRGASSGQGARHLKHAGRPGKPGFLVLPAHPVRTHAHTLHARADLGDGIRQQAQAGQGAIHERAATGVPGAGAWCALLTLHTASVHAYILSCTHISHKSKELMPPACVRWKRLRERTAWGCTSLGPQGLLRLVPLVHESEDEHRQRTSGSTTTACVKHSIRVFEL